MTPTLKISVIIACAGRPDVRESLRGNQPFLNKDYCEVVLVTNRAFSGTLQSILEDAGYSNTRLVVLDAARFNKSLFLNIAAKEAKADVLFFLDCDVVLKNNLLPKVISTVEKGWQLRINKVHESQNLKAGKPVPNIQGAIKKISYSIHFSFHNRKTAGINNSTLFINESARDAPGLVAVSKQDFVAVGGYNSELVSWGWEDLDFLFRLKALTGKKMIRSGEAIHLSHGDNLRNLGGMDKGLSDRNNFMMCLANYNLGLFEGSYEKDILENEPVSG